MMEGVRGGDVSELPQVALGDVASMVAIQTMSRRPSYVSISMVVKNALCLCSCSRALASILLVASCFLLACASASMLTSRQTSLYLFAMDH